MKTNSRAKALCATELRMMYTLFEGVNTTPTTEIYMKGAFKEWSNAVSTLAKCVEESDYQRELPRLHKSVVYMKGLKQIITLIEGLAPQFSPEESTRLVLGKPSDRLRVAKISVSQSYKGFCQELSTLVDAPRTFHRDSDGHYAILEVQELSPDELHFLVSDTLGCGSFNLTWS